MGLRDTGRRQAKQKHNTENLNDVQHGLNQKLGVKPGAV